MEKQVDSLPSVAIVAMRAAKRAAIAEALSGLVRARQSDFAELRHTGRFVDASATIAVLEPESFDAEVEALAQLREKIAGQRLVIVAEGIAEPALDAVLARLGAFACLPDPPPPPALRCALRGMASEMPSGKGARTDQRPSRAIVGVSKAIREILVEVARIAPTRLPVLVLGETGTGKELIARAIHEQSERAARPFVAVNCGALPEALLEAELFGSMRGAFTGAARDRKGLFEQANGGTLFLDEIGEMTPALQVKLLRVLQEGELRPIGAERTVRVDVRIVCATHRELDALIASGAFRQDLFYRVNAATIYVPPLRRRRVDIPFLAQHFAEEFGEAQARRVVLDEAFLRSLEAQELPGNVRELRNLIERAIALTRPGESLVTTLPGIAPAPAGLAAAAPGALQRQVDALEHRLIREALQLHAGNRTHVAKALGLSRQGLRNRMARHRIE